MFIYRENLVQKETMESVFLHQSLKKIFSMLMQTPVILKSCTVSSLDTQYQLLLEITILQTHSSSTVSV